MVLSERRYRLLLFGAVLVGAIIAAWPTILAFFEPSFQGLLPYNGSEEAMYFIRTQEALLHPFTDASNGVWKGGTGLQSSGIEEAIGALLRWTGVSAPWIVFFLHLLIAPLVIPLGAGLVRRVGASRGCSLMFGIVLFWFFVYCRRFFHPSFSLPLVLLTLLLLWRWYEKPVRSRAVAVALPLGFSVGAYLWSWTFLWPTTALLVIFVACDASHPSRSGIRKTLPWLILCTGLVASPAFFHLIAARLHPSYAAAAFRAGLAFTRAPESIARSALTVVLFFAAAWMFRQQRERRLLLPLLAILGALAIDYNQQAFHGFVMSFSSHYIPYVSVGLLLLLVSIVLHAKRGIVSFSTSIISIGVLSLVFMDTPGRAVAFLPPHPSTMRLQHLRGAFDTLATLEPTTILTDHISADIIASYTALDVLFTEYSAFLLTSDEEYITRACLSELFDATPVSYETLVVHAEERLRMLRGQETQDQYHRSLVRAHTLCANIRRAPLPFLRSFGVQYLFWNERGEPAWHIDERLFERVKNGDGWSLWKLRDRDRAKSASHTLDAYPILSA